MPPGRVMENERFLAVIGPRAALAMARLVQARAYGSALLRGVHQVGVVLVVAVHGDDVAAEVHLGLEVVQVEAVELQADRSTGVDLGRHVLPRLAW